MNIIKLLPIFLFAGLMSCSQKGKNLSVDWEDKLIESPEIFELEQIRDLVLLKLSQNDVSRKDYLKTYSLNNYSATAKLLNCSTAEIIRLTQRLQNNSYSLIQNNSNIKDLLANDININTFIEYYEQIIPKYQYKLLKFSKNSQRVGCKYGQYSTCLMLAGYGAAATGGAALLVYAGGSYLCLCSYCSGGWVSWACF
jgi:hypothetical protein